MNINTFLMMLSILVLGGCVTATPVVGTPNGNMKLVTYSSEKEYALDKAYKTANKTCEKSGKMAIVVREEIRYQGLLDEKMNKAVKTAKDAVWSAGQYTASEAMGGFSQSDDYEVKVEFKCE